MFISDKVQELFIHHRKQNLHFSFVPVFFFPWLPLLWPLTSYCYKNMICHAFSQLEHKGQLYIVYSLRSGPLELASQLLRFSERDVQTSKTS